MIYMEHRYHSFYEIIYLCINTTVTCKRSDENLEVIKESVGGFGDDINT